MHMSERLPTLTTYEAALRHYNSVVPLRAGNKKGERPLGAVRRYIRSLIRLEPNYRSDRNPDLNPSAGNTAGNTENTGNGLAKDVVLSYYDNDIIRFTPDDRVIVSTCGWSSISTYGFISDVLGMRLKFSRARSRIYYVQTGVGSHLLPQDGKSGVTIDLHTGEATGGGTVETYALDKPAMNALRGKFKEFINYAHNCILMQTPVQVDIRSETNLYVTASTLTWRGRYGKLTKPQKDLRADILTLATRDAGYTEEQTLDRYYEAFNRLAASAIAVSPIARFKNGLSFSAPCDRGTFDAFFTNVLKLSYADSLFCVAQHTSPMPKLPSDKNKFFFVAKDY